jgi:hypothetical protein
VAQHLILWNQSAFIPTLSIHHAVLFCLEILHQGRVSSTPVVFLQVDFCKAYDKVKWGFLRDFFAGVGFSARFQLLLKAITQGSQSQVLINGSRGSPFAITQYV